jgi:hypothetical protein
MRRTRHAPRPMHTHAPARRPRSTRIHFILAPELGASKTKLRRCVRATIAAPGETGDDAGPDGAAASAAAAGMAAAVLLVSNDDEDDGNGCSGGAVASGVSANRSGWDAILQPPSR